MKKLKPPIYIVILATILFSPLFAFAEVMESNNYRLESDEIDMGAIGEMRDFSGSHEREGPITGASEASFNFSFSWKLLLVIAGIFLFLVFAFKRMKHVYERINTN